MLISLGKIFTDQIQCAKTVKSTCYTVVKSFNNLSLRITIQTNLKTVNFLDITLNFCNGKYYPYRKPNDRPLYVNRLLNHPPSILKHQPAAISRCLTGISHDACGIFAVLFSSCSFGVHKNIYIHLTSSLGHHVNTYVILIS